MNENFQGIKTKLLFGAIVNVIATVVYIIVFWCFLKEPSPLIGTYATDPQFLSIWAVVFPALITFCALSIAVSLIGVIFLLNRFENARQSMRTSNRWKDMLLARSKDQILTSNFGLLAAPSEATTNANAFPLQDSERVVIILKAEPFDFSTLVSAAISKPQPKSGAMQIPVTMPFLLGEQNWEKVQVLCDPNGKTPRLIKNDQGDMWGVLQTRSALVSQMMTMFMRRSKER
ncbi:hypothetical protein BH10CYA1_BH10CYA1_58230 [soil metagenome]